MSHRIACPRSGAINTPKDWREAVISEARNKGKRNIRNGGNTRLYKALWTEGYQGTGYLRSSVLLMLYCYLY